MSEKLFWVGGYTATMDAEATGIGVARARADGSFEFVQTAVETSSPSFLADGVVDGIVYAVDEGNRRVEAFRREGLQLLHQGGHAVSGTSPCHLSVAPDWLYVSNYGDGSVDVFPLAAAGEIGPLAQSLQGVGRGPHNTQDGPHAHSTLVTGEKTVLSADLGADRVYVHRQTDTGLERIGFGEFPAGTGPRDLLAVEDRIYLLGELDGTLFSLDAHAGIVAHGSSIADWVDGDHAAALAIDASGRFLYTGLRGSNRVAVARADDLSPLASVPTGGDWPRHLWVSGDILYVANQLSSTVTSFRIDPTTGIPQLIGVPERVPSPTYILPAR
ncbi:beta-propeller fold lactonase family protein [Glaciihabitans sp. UYNi722]|uniref:lactonase family protein n=1 Tax=Glaciihabitans sp. UYNi722 TaxID=3156344 RepID=UPI00339328E2